jgi:2-oxoglutarate dehydrogenase E1 component
MEEKNNMQKWQQESYLAGNNADYLEALYESYLKNPDKVDQKWKDYFVNLANGSQAPAISHEDIREQFRIAAKTTHQKENTGTTVSVDSQQLTKMLGVTQLVEAYRQHGHRLATTDPLNLTILPRLSILELSYHGLSETDLASTFTLPILGNVSFRLSEIIQRMKKIYCGNVGTEYDYITNEEELNWIKQRLETIDYQSLFSLDEKKKILADLVMADGLEKYLGSKYAGQKRFSLEGGDSLIPALNEIIQSAAAQGVKECAIGMAHRGRLNVLLNILGKSPQDLFNAFEGKLDDRDNRSGDVKYHLGFSSNIESQYGIIHLALAFNPSHLEIVSPVVAGTARAHQRCRHDKDGVQVLPITIHGDAAIAAQGVVMETLSFSQTRGFQTGGSIRIVINNQVGFTISNPKDARSTPYCTDIAKMIEAPVFHVNGNDPEAVCFVARLAADYRAKFHKDVFIDLVCFRRHGHNEADEPSATQPLMYKVVRAMPSVYEIYGQQLIEKKLITPEELTQYVDNYRALLDAGKSSIKTVSVPPSGNWTPYLSNLDLALQADTKVAKEKLVALAHQLEKLPEGFVLQAQVAKMMEDRKKMTSGELLLNWGYAETLAYAVLLDKKFSVRLCGQDAGRGTFAHRHAQLYDQNNGSTYYPLASINTADDSTFTCVDSLLSEEAVMAFEYGYAASDPTSLVLWEGQFGDFANGAQVVIDQFLSSGEQKWNRLCGLTLLLPHGYEGMGPEHTSARLERFLQLCAQDNMSVCVPTTPAQIYHLLLRQMVRPVRKPLIIMTPKSLLRHKLAVSSADELATGQFKLVYPETDEIKSADVKKVVLCSGKVYYDLLQKRRDVKLNHIAILRIEELYPFPKQQLMDELAKYRNAKTVIWCQEEPLNQGAWYQINFQLRACTVEQGRDLDYVGRPACASPATGSAKRHAVEQETLVMAALA